MSSTDIPTEVRLEPTATPEIKRDETSLQPPEAVATSPIPHKSQHEQDLAAAALASNDSSAPGEVDGAAMSIPDLPNATTISASLTTGDQVNVVSVTEPLSPQVQTTAPSGSLEPDDNKVHQVHEDVVASAQERVAEHHADVLILDGDSVEGDDDGLEVDVFDTMLDDPGLQDSAFSEDHLSLSNYSSMEMHPVFSDADVENIFVVQQLLRSSGGYRPYFQFEGSMVSLEVGEEGTIGAVVKHGQLLFDIHYEPPSPKFKRALPGHTSYRLKLTRDDEFLYSTRGLPEQLTVDRAACLVWWGRLKAAFAEQAALDSFLANLKYADVTEGYLLPEVTRDLWRQIAAGASVASVTLPMGEPTRPRTKQLLMQHLVDYRTAYMAVAAAAAVAVVGWAVVSLRRTRA